MTADDLVRQAINAGVRIACAESCTGGMVSAAITDVPGSSAVLDRGFVTYSNAAKIDMLGVDPATLEKFGAVSPEVALQMAEGALRQARVDIGVSVTGIAGPGGSGFKPEGRVCFGLAASGRKTLVETVEFGAPGRDKVRAAACAHALQLLITAVHQLPEN